MGFDWVGRRGFPLLFGAFNLSCFSVVLYQHTDVSSRTGTAIVHGGKLVVHLLHRFIQKSL